MAIAIALIVIVVGSLLFHAVTPWWLTPLASNWSKMDDTLAITLVITGAFFVIINLFIAYSLWRFRHRDGHRAAYEPDNHKLERRLTIFTSVGIIALLAPGLFVYADYVQAPHDAMVVDVVGKQWQWHFRFPDANGKLAPTQVRLISGTNPFGLDPDDPVAHDNVLITAGEVHLPLNKPVKLLLRSDDVLHDFYVPQFRGRMNIVPGMVTSFWFTPTRAGRYEVMCAQLCGVGHYNMRAYVVVEEEAAFRTWLAAQPTFAKTMERTKGGGAGVAGPATPEGLMEQGKTLAQSKGCVACHSLDGSPGVGPTWKGLYGKTETMADGSTALVDDAYLKDDIANPSKRVVKGFPPIMPKIDLGEDELNALVAYIKSVSGTAAPGQKAQK
ncbi:MAG: c-type cytochrome [Burkholderia sp.]|nr:c-type cytochrome [Burkholderia sp.]